MTEHEIDVAMAELNGWSHGYETSHGETIEVWRHPKSLSSNLPNCSRDLNAFREAIFSSPRHIKILFSRKLREVVSRYHVNWVCMSEDERNYYVENSTSHQRCEAFLSLNNAWK